MHRDLEALAKAGDFTTTWEVLFNEFTDIDCTLGFKTEFDKKKLRQTIQMKFDEYFDTGLDPSDPKIWRATP